MEKFVEQASDEEVVSVNKVDRKLVSLVLLLSAQIIIGAICLIYRASGPEVPMLLVVAEGFANAITPRESCIVQIVGRINKPGVYTVESGTRVCELIELAGGMILDADINSINLARPVEDEEKIVVPSKDSISIEADDRDKNIVFRKR